MSQNAAIDRNAGAGGFDWAFHQYDTVGADDDMMINNKLAGVPIPVVVNRDRWQETEADSGSALQRRHPGRRRRAAASSAAPGSPAATCSTRPAWPGSRASTALTTCPSPLARRRSRPRRVACSARRHAARSDAARLGRGQHPARRWRQRHDRGSRRRRHHRRRPGAARCGSASATNPADPATEIGSTDLMEHQYQRDATGNPTGTDAAGGRVQRARSTRATSSSSARSSPAPASDTGVDTAVFVGPASSYSDHDWRRRRHECTVEQDGAPVGSAEGDDGKDTLYNVERLQFPDGRSSIAGSAALARRRARLPAT